MCLLLLLLLPLWSCLLPDRDGDDDDDADDDADDDGDDERDRDRERGMRNLGGGREEGGAIELIREGCVCVGEGRCMVDSGSNGAFLPAATPAATDRYNCCSADCRCWARCRRLSCPRKRRRACARDGRGCGLCVTDGKVCCVLQLPGNFVDCLFSVFQIHTATLHTTVTDDGRSSAAASTAWSHVNRATFERRHRYGL